LRKKVIDNHSRQEGAQGKNFCAPVFYPHKKD